MGLKKDLTVNYTILMTVLKIDGILVYDNTSFSNKNKKQTSSSSSSQHLGQISAIASISRNHNMETSLPSRPLLPENHLTSKPAKNVDNNENLLRKDDSNKYIALWAYGPSEIVHGSVVMKTRLHKTQLAKNKFDTKIFEVTIGLVRGVETIVIGISNLHINGPVSGETFELPIFPLSKHDNDCRLAPSDSFRSEDNMDQQTVDSSAESVAESIYFLGDMGRKYRLAKGATIRAHINVLESHKYENLLDNVIADRALLANRETIQEVRDSKRALLEEDDVLSKISVDMISSVSNTVFTYQSAKDHLLLQDVDMNSLINPSHVMVHPNPPPYLTHNPPAYDPYSVGYEIQPSMNGNMLNVYAFNLAPDGIMTMPNGGNMFYPSIYPMNAQGNQLLRPIENKDDVLDNMTISSDAMDPQTVGKKRKGDETLTLEKTTLGSTTLENSKTLDTIFNLDESKTNYESKTLDQSKTLDTVKNSKRDDSADLFDHMIKTFMGQCNGFFDIDASQRPPDLVTVQAKMMTVDDDITLHLSIDEPDGSRTIFSDAAALAGMAEKSSALNHNPRVDFQRVNSRFEPKYLRELAQKQGSEEKQESIGSSMACTPGTGLVADSLKKAINALNILANSEDSDSDPSKSKYEKKNSSKSKKDSSKKKKKNNEFDAEDILNNCKDSKKLTKESKIKESKFNTKNTRDEKGSESKVERKKGGDDALKRNVSSRSSEKAQMKGADMTSAIQNLISKGSSGGYGETNNKSKSRKMEKKDYNNPITKPDSKRVSSYNSIPYIEKETEMNNATEDQKPRPTHTSNPYKEKVIEKHKSTIDKTPKLDEKIVSSEKKTRDKEDIYQNSNRSESRLKSRDGKRSSEPLSSPEEAITFNGKNKQSSNKYSSEKKVDGKDTTKDMTKDELFNELNRMESLLNANVEQNKSTERLLRENKSKGTRDDSIKGEGRSESRLKSSREDIKKSENTNSMANTENKHHTPKDTIKHSKEASSESRGAEGKVEKVPVSGTGIKEPLPFKKVSSRTTSSNSSKRGNDDDEVYINKDNVPSRFESTKTINVSNKSSDLKANGNTKGIDLSTRVGSTATLTRNNRTTRPPSSVKENIRPSGSSEARPRIPKGDKLGTITKPKQRKEKMNVEVDDLSQASI